MRSAYTATTVLIRGPRNRRGWKSGCEQAVIRASLHRAIGRARDGVRLRTWSSLVGASTGRPRSARDKGRNTAGSATGSLKGDWTPLARGRKLCVILKRDAGAGNLSLSCRASSSPSSSYTGAEVDGCWDSARKAVVEAAPLWSCALPVPEDGEAAGTAGDGLLFVQQHCMWQTWVVPAWRGEGGGGGGGRGELVNGNDSDSCGKCPTHAVPTRHAPSPCCFASLRAWGRRAGGPTTTMDGV